MLSHLQVVLKDSDPVQMLQCNCSCVAGKALCNHSVALLFQSAHYSQLNLQVVPPILSCTEGEQQWHKPRTMVSLRDNKCIIAENIQQQANIGYITQIYY